MCRWWRNRQISPELSDADVKREFKVCGLHCFVLAIWVAVFTGCLCPQGGLPHPKRPAEGYGEAKRDPHREKVFQSIVVSGGR